MRVTQFMDMHSGGKLKLPPYQYIYLEAPSEHEATELFTSYFGISPFNTTCKCCGQDFYIEDFESFDEASAYQRRCEWNGKKYILESAKISTVQYLKKKSVLFIPYSILKIRLSK